jgi:hypothetical protein
MRILVIPNSREARVKNLMSLALETAACENALHSSPCVR